MARRVAKRKVVMTPEGPKVVFVDTKTGKVVTDLKGYGVLGTNDEGQQTITDPETGEEITDDAPEAKDKLETEKAERPERSDSTKYTDIQKGFGVSEVRSRPKGPSPSVTQVTGKAPVGAVQRAPVSPVGESGAPQVYTGTATPNLRAPAPVGQPGVDLESRPRQVANVNYNMGPNRPNVPQGGIVEKVQDVVTDVLGPNYSVELTSGQEDEGHQYGSPRHKTGLAGDFRVVGPDGQPVTDQGLMSDLAQGMAARYGANIGYGPNYMGESVMHIDTVDPSSFTAGQDAQWGETGNSWTDTLTQARDEGLMPGSYYDRMTQNAPSNLMTRDEALRSPNEATATVAFDRFNEDERDLMARTLAGEIDTRYTDLSTPEGIKEAMGVLSTMENRAQKYGNITNAITADKQYSTWNNQAAADVANQNYTSNKQMYDSLVNDYMSNPENNLGYSSYYNPSIANPSWGAEMADATDIGPHRFGTLAEYGGPSTAGSSLVGRVLDSGTDNVTGTSGLMASASTNVNLGTVTDSSSGGMTSSENASRGFMGGGTDPGRLDTSGSNNAVGGGSTGGVGGSYSSGSGSPASNVGGGFGSGTSGTGGGSYGGSGRSYSSEGSTSGSTSGGFGGHSYGGGSDPSNDGMGGRSDGWS